MSTFREDLFQGTGSDLTSNVAFVGDAIELTVQPIVVSETTITLEGSNSTGFRTAIAEAEWSQLTVSTALAASDLFNIEPGFRFIRAIRESSNSLSQAVISGRNAVWGRG